MTSSSPLIGVTGRRGAGTLIGVPAGFFDIQLDIYMTEYATSVLASRGLPVHLAIDSPPAEIVQRLDGLLIAGGEDVDPRRYGEAPGPLTTRIDRVRDSFEIGLVLAAVQRGIPVLGICRGCQLVNVAFGGSLVGDLPVGDGQSHNSLAYHRADRVHRVSFAPDSLARTLYGAETTVNSFHHQAVARPGEGVCVSGRADDGVVEAIEAADGLVLGVQWHPEVFGGDAAFDWLVNTARDNTQLTKKAKAS